VKSSGCLAPCSVRSVGWQPLTALAVALLVVGHAAGRSSQAFPGPWSHPSSLCSGSRSPSFPADSPGGDAHPFACLLALPCGAGDGARRCSGVSVAAVHRGVQGAREALVRAPGGAGPAQGAACGGALAGKRQPAGSVRG